MAEKMREANGTAKIKGTKIKELGVGRSVLEDEECKRGRTENRVRSRVRPMASGSARRSSIARDGLAGSMRWIGVRV